MNGGNKNTQKNTTLETTRKLGTIVTLEATRTLGTTAKQKTTRTLGATATLQNN